MSVSSKTLNAGLLTLISMFCASSLSALALPMFGESLRGTAINSAAQNATVTKVSNEHAITQAIQYILAAKAAAAREYKPRSEAARLAHAGKLMDQHKFQDLKENFGEWIGAAHDLKETIAVGNIALKVGDLESAESAFMKARFLANGQSLSDEGMQKIAWQKQESRNHLLLAREHIAGSKKSDALTELNLALVSNPKNTEARLLIADLLLKNSDSGPMAYRTAAGHYRACLLLNYESASDRKKIEKKITALENKALRAEQKLIATRH